MRMVAVFFGMIILMVTACNSNNRSAEQAQAEPKALAETIFYLIRTEKYDALPALVDQEADKDSKQLAALKDADATLQKQAKEYFGSAVIDGEPVIDGDKATVKVKLGHKASFEETFEMVRKNGKWYLQSF